MKETNIRTFLAALICAFTMLGVSSCAFSPFRAKQVKQEKIPILINIAKVDTSLQTSDNDPAVLKHSYNAVWLASQKTIRQMGLISGQNMAAGHLQAHLRGADVDVNIAKIGPGSTRLIVTALKDASNDSELSVEIFNKIRDLTVLF